MAKGLARWYSDSYLAEIGQPGTNGCGVVDAAGNGLLKIRGGLYVVPGSAPSLSAALPRLAREWVADPGYVHGGYWETRYVCDEGAPAVSGETYHLDAEYGNGRCDRARLWFDGAFDQDGAQVFEPEIFAGEKLASRTNGDYSWEDRYFAQARLGGVRYPYWGTPAEACPDCASAGLAQPGEGLWHAHLRVLLDLRLKHRGGPPDYHDESARLNASADGVLVAAARHRIGAGLAFAPSGNPVVDAPYPAGDRADLAAARAAMRDCVTALWNGVSFTLEWRNKSVAP